MALFLWPQQWRKFLYLFKDGHDAMTLWSPRSLIAFPLKLQLAWCIAKLPRRFGRSFRPCFLKGMVQGSINCKRILLVFLKVSSLWVITSQVFQFCGMKYRIMSHCLFVHVRSVYVMWMRGFLIFITEKPSCSFWWVLMILSLTFGVKKRGLNLKDPVRRSGKKIGLIEL